MSKSTGFVSSSKTSSAATMLKKICCIINDKYAAGMRLSQALNLYLNPGEVISHQD